MWSKRRRLAQAAPILVLFSLLSWQVWAASQEERLGYWSADGGGGRMTGGTLVMNGTAGQPDAGVSTGGNLELQGGIWHSVQIATGIDGPSDLPVVHELMAPSPNPFNPRTTVRFQLASSTRVRVEIHDVRGRLVRTLVDGQRAAGEHKIVWDGIDDRGHTVASGTYYLRLTADGQVRTQKMALLK